MTIKKALNKSENDVNPDDELIKKSDVIRLIENIKCNDTIPKNYGTLLDIIRLIRLMPSVNL